MIIMDKSRIISEIESRVNNLKTADYTPWTVGISDTPKVRKDQHDNDGKDIGRWKDWSIDSEKDGREIEDYFLGKGMKGDAGGGSAGYVYIF
jgi:ribosomal protein S6E (S10)